MRAGRVPPRSANDSTFLDELRLFLKVKSFLHLLFFLTIGTMSVSVMSEDAKKTKAKQDCDTLCQAIMRYQALEGAMPATLLDLRSKYIANIDTLRDPWGEAYMMDAEDGYCFSPGPDRSHIAGDPDATANADDVRVSFFGPPTLVCARLEANPTGERDPRRAFDALRLRFQRRVRIPAGADIDFEPERGAWAADPVERWDPASGTEVEYRPDPFRHPDAAMRAGRRADPGLDAGVRLRFFPAKGEAPVRFRRLLTVTRGESTNLFPEGSRAVYGSAADPASRDTGAYRAGRIYHTDDSREIVIALPAGSAGALRPGAHRIDLAGTRINRDKEGRQGNPLVRSFFSPEGGVMRPDGPAPIESDAGDRRAGW